MEIARGFPQRYLRDDEKISKFSTYNGEIKKLDVHKNPLYFTAVL